jgi:hypothetical protein
MAAEGITQVNSRLQSIEARLPGIEKQVDDHSEWINGNGKVGAKTRLATLENGFQRIEGLLNKLTGWLIGLVITLVGGFLMWFLTNLLPQITAHIGQ